MPSEPRASFLICKQYVVAVQLMLQYVEQLLASPNNTHHEMAHEIMSELNTQEVPADADVMREIDNKVTAAAYKTCCCCETPDVPCAEGCLVLPDLFRHKIDPVMLQPDLCTKITACSFSGCCVVPSIGRAKITHMLERNCRLGYAGQACRGVDTGGQHHRVLFMHSKSSRVQRSIRRGD